MEMQVRSSIQNLVLAFRADATDKQTRIFNETNQRMQNVEEAAAYAFTEVSKFHNVCGLGSKRIKKATLGCGAYSAAMEHPEDDTKVIKVWLNGPDGCWTYINKCWQQDEPEEWMPVIYGLGMCMGKPYAIMERLTGKVVVASEIRHKLESKFGDHFGFYPNDVHSGNVMFRAVIAADGVPIEVPVLTDPVTHWE